jgi:hypothetical protein
MDGGKPYELDVLSPIESTYRNDNLLYYPEAYKNDYYTLLIVLLFFEFGITCVAFILSPPSSANVNSA